MEGFSLRRVAFVLVTTMVVSGSVSAQERSQTPDLRQLTRAGETIEITDTNGKRVRGKVLDLSPEVVNLAITSADQTRTSRAVAAPDIERIVRVDSLRNGTLLGLLIGIGAGIAPGVAMAQYCENEAGGGCASWFLTTDLVIGGIGAAIGAGIDGVNKETIYSARASSRTPSPKGPASSLVQLQRTIKPGETVAVTNASGVEIRGRIARVSPEAITLALPGGEMTIEERQLRDVQRIGDPLWNGALIGLGAGFGAGLLSMARCDAGLVCGAAAGPVVLVESAVGAGLGIGIDALHRGRKLVYVNRDTAVPSSTSKASINVSPVFGGTTRGVMMSVRF